MVNRMSRNKRRRMVARWARARDARNAVASLAARARPVFGNRAPIRDRMGARVRPKTGSGDGNGASSDPQPLSVSPAPPVHF
eukprot:9504147-Pyramimonas_sp.AAC.3